MSKNLTRKGLAFGALVALGASVIAGAPASAATTPLGSAISTTYDGTGLTVIEGTDFEVSTAIAADYAYYNTVEANEFTSAGGRTETYLVCTEWNTNDYWFDGPDGDDDQDDWGNGIDVCIDQDLQVLTRTQANAIGFHVEEALSSYGSNYNFLSADILGSGATPADAIQVTSPWASTAGLLKWKKSSTAASVSNTDSAATFSIDPIAADTAVTFTPYLDIDGDSTLDAVEPSGSATVVTFANNVQQLTVALTGVPNGVTAQDITAKVTGPAGYNLKQMLEDGDSDLRVRLIRSNTIVGTSSDNPLVTDNVGSKTWTNEPTGYYTAQVVLDEAYTDIAYSPVSAQMIVGQISPISALDGIEIVDVASENENEYGDVRAGVKSIEISAQILDSSDKAIAAAGVDVKFVVSGVGVSVDSVLKLNGGTITTPVTVKTDANGIAKVTVTSTTGTHDDDFDITAYVILSNGSTQSDEKGYDWEATAVDNLFEVHNTDADNSVVSFGGDNNGVAHALKGGKVTLEYSVYDQFGQPLNIPGRTYRFLASSGFWGGVSLPAAVINGKAVLTFDETRNPGSRYTVTGQLQYSTDGFNTFSSAGDSVSTDVVVGTTATAGALTVNADNTLAHHGTAANLAAALQISTGLFVDYNNVLREDENITDSLEEGYPTSNKDISVSGVVLDANNVPIAGAPVTISLARGGQIEVETDDGGDIYSTGTVTVYADAYGRYAVDFNTRFAGDNVVNVSSLGKTASVTITVNTPDADVRGVLETDVLTSTGVSGLVPGSVVPVTVKLVDKYGNAVKNALVSTSSTGIGFLEDATVVTDATGVINAKLVTSPQQPGSATVTSTVTITATSKSKTAVATVEVAVPVISAAVSTSTSKLVFEIKNAKRELVIIKVGNKVIKRFAAYSNLHNFGIFATKGSKSVKVFIGNELVISKTLTVK